MWNMKNKLAVGTAAAALTLGGVGVSSLHAEAEEDVRARSAAPKASTQEQVQPAAAEREQAEVEYNAKARTAAEVDAPEAQNFEGHIMSLREYMIHGVSQSEEATPRGEAEQAELEARAETDIDVDRDNRGNVTLRTEREGKTEVEANAEAKAHGEKADKVHKDWKAAHADKGPMVLVLKNDGARALVPGRTAYVIVPADNASDDLKAKCSTMDGRNVKVTARQYERGGLNLLIVENVQPAMADADKQ